MSDDEQKIERVASRANRATLALLALLIAAGLARQLGLLDPILAYGVGGGLACCLLIVQLDRLHTRGRRSGHAQPSAPEHEDRNGREL